VIVLDTHAWLWWVAAPQKLSGAAARVIERADRIGVSAACVFELADLVERNRVALDVPTRTWIREALSAERVEPLAVTTRIALDAAGLRFVGDPFDRLIYATAVAEDALLVTRDARLRDFDTTRTVW
jgi:PIN domain nuclease of toxin-antitoxin system